MYIYILLPVEDLSLLKIKRLEILHMSTFDELLSTTITSSDT